MFIPISGIVVNFHQVTLQNGYLKKQINKELVTHLRISLMLFDDTGLSKDIWCHVYHTLFNACKSPDQTQVTRKVSCQPGDCR